MRRTTAKDNMQAGDRRFVKRTSLVLVECFDNPTNNVNDSRPYVYHEVTIAAQELLVPEANVPDTIERILA